MTPRICRRQPVILTIDLSNETLEVVFQLLKVQGLKRRDLFSGFHGTD